eukprot:427549_1
MSAAWKCQNCELFNSKHREKCQACFTTQPIIQRITITVLNGYFRENENILKQDIPQEIRHIIMNYIEKRIIFGAGRNSGGQLGLKHIQTVSKFERLYGLEIIVNTTKNIYNNDCVLFVKSDNKIFASGSNYYLQLGIHKKTSELTTDYKKDVINTISTFTEIPNIKNVSIISKGVCNSHTTYLTTLDNKLYMNILTEINTLWLNIKEYIINIECGSLHSMFLTSNNNIYALGNNEEGQCIKHTNYKDILVPILVDQNIKIVCCGDWFTSLVTIDNIGKCAGDLRLITHNKNIINTQCGARHCLFLDCDGNVYTVGTDNSCGQRGFKRDKNKIIGKNEQYLIDVNDIIIDISCGGDHSIVLTEKNNLFFWGFNGFGQCSSISDHYIWEPQLFNKRKELGAKYFIEKVICLHNETIIVIDPFALN